MTCVVDRRVFEARDVLDGLAKLRVPVRATI